MPCAALRRQHTSQQYIMFPAHTGPLHIHSPSNITDTAWHIYGTAWLECSWKPIRLGSFDSIQKISSVPVVTLEVKVCRRSVYCRALYGSTVRWRTHW